jgi:hypothetical protein
MICMYPDKYKLYKRQQQANNSIMDIEVDALTSSYFTLLTSSPKLTTTRTATMSDALHLNEHNNNNDYTDNLPKQEHPPDSNDNISKCCTMKMVKMLL